MTVGFFPVFYASNLNLFFFGTKGINNLIIPSFYPVKTEFPGEFFILKKHGVMDKSFDSLSDVLRVGIRDLIQILLDRSRIRDLVHDFKLLSLFF